MAAGILLCIGVAFLSFLALSKLTPPSGTLAQLTTNGAAIIYGINGSQRPALPHDVITTGETVAATMGDAVIVLEHQMAEMTLRAGSQLRFPANIGDPKNVALLFHLEQGRIRADVAPRTAITPFKISSPIAALKSSAPNLNLVSIQPRRTCPSITAQCIYQPQPITVSLLKPVVRV
jgi:hypothetical protein